MSTSPMTPAQASPSTLRTRKLTAPLLVRRILRRDRLDDVLDGLRLRIDTFPRGLYQPVDLPVRTALRATGTASRWGAIREVVAEREIESLVDVGANAGYFTIQFGRLGITSLAVEAEAGTCRTASLAIRRGGLSGVVGVLQLEIRPDTVHLLPEADAVLCLSLWHHLVAHQGLPAATEVLQALWDRSRKVLFFDTGEVEMGPEFKLPEMQPNPRAWLERYLTATCAGAEVLHLGEHDAFDAEGRPARRNLFALVRGKAAASL
jgi:hypothetical protein